MAIFSTRSRERIIAITATVLLHALVVLSIVRCDGGAPGSPSAREGGAGQGAVQSVVEFVALPKKAAQAPPEVSVPLDARAETPAQEPVAEAATPSASSQPTPPGQTSANDQEGGGTGAPEEDLGARYLAAVRAAIDRQWQAQGGGDIPAGCEVVIDQVNGGRVQRAWVVNCGALQLADRIRLETAVMQTQSLPYAGFEAVFQERLRLTF